MGSQILINPFVVAIVVPLILLISGSLAKKLVRGSPWQRQDFFLGVEFSLVSMSSALIYIFELVRRLSAAQQKIVFQDVTDKLIATAVFISVTFFLLLGVLAAHQDWESRNDDPRAQFLRLGILANVIGSGLLITFILLVKGVAQ